MKLINDELYRTDVLWREIRQPMIKFIIASPKTVVSSRDKLWEYFIVNDTISQTSRIINNSLWN